MDTLRRKFEGIFYRNKPKPEENEDSLARDVIDLMQQQQQQLQQEEQQRTQAQAEPLDDGDLQRPPSTLFNLTTADPPAECGPMAVQVPGVPRYVVDNGPTINYKMEFVNFINRNAPPGFGEKFQKMLPYLGISFVSWPSYWLWRGYYWQTKRRTERIGVYIQRTFQHAKVMQVAILGLGLIMASSTRAASGSLDVHEVAYNSNQQADDE